MRHGRVLGVFLDNTWRTDFDFGRVEPPEIAIEMTEKETTALHA